MVKVDQLPKQDGGQLLPFKGSIDRLPPACSRNTPTTSLQASASTTKPSHGGVQIFRSGHQ
jgi:hypothetical protein